MADAKEFQDSLELMGQLEQANAAMGGDPEANRNVASSDLFEAMVREAYNGVTSFGAGHHFMYFLDGVTMPREIPSADALIFNHDIAQKVWGDNWKAVLTKLALEPVKTRDVLLRELYQGR
jgi:hypothetical protein